MHVAINTMLYIVVELSIYRQGILVYIQVMMISDSVIVFQFHFCFN